MSPSIKEFIGTTSNCSQLCRDESAVSTPEYALLLAFIALGTVGAVISLKDQIITLFTTNMLAGS